MTEQPPAGRYEAERDALRKRVTKLEGEAAKWEDAARCNYANYISAAMRSDVRRLQIIALRADLDAARRA